jgi:hypothetical protein
MRMEDERRDPWLVELFRGSGPWSHADGTHNPGVISLRLVSMAQRHLAAHKFSVAAPVFAELAAAHPQAMLASRREGSVERDTSVTSSGTNYSLT